MCKAQDDLNLEGIRLVLRGITVFDVHFIVSTSAVFEHIA